MIDFLQDLWEDGWVTRLVALVVLSGVLALSVVITDLCWADCPSYLATVIDRGVTSSGKMVTVITSSADKWNVIVSHVTDGRIEVAQATKERWASLGKGDRVWVRERVGKLVGICWSKEIQ